MISLDSAATTLFNTSSSPPTFGFLSPTSTAAQPQIIDAGMSSRSPLFSAFSYIQEDFSSSSDATLICLCRTTYCIANRTSLPSSVRLKHLRHSLINKHPGLTRSLRTVESGANAINPTLPQPLWKSFAVLESQHEHHASRFKMLVLSFYVALQISTQLRRPAGTEVLRI